MDSSPGGKLAGTAVSSSVPDLNAIGASVPPNETETDDDRFSPIIETAVPICPCAGSMDVMDGFGFSGSLHVKIPAASHNNVRTDKNDLILFIIPGIRI
jgi:hypothetical protein